VLTCAAVCAGAAIAGCGGSGGSGSSTSSTSSDTSVSSSSTGTSETSSTTTSQSRHKRPQPKLPAVGQTQSLGAYGSLLHVTVTNVIDPLPYHGANVLSGTRPVGVEVRIAVVGGATYDSTASGDWSLSLQPASADAAPLDIKSGVCETPLQDFESAIYGGDVRVGCVAFSLPEHAKIAAIIFSAHSNPAKSVRWR
jgi:hypothetical protein